jgi:small subunit ribosomal protein S16
VGFYNPVAKGASEGLRLDMERIEKWVGQGAQPSERVARLLRDYRKAKAKAAA